VKVEVHSGQISSMQPILTRRQKAFACPN